MQFFGVEMWVSLLHTDTDSLVVACLLVGSWFIYLYAFDPMWRHIYLCKTNEISFAIYRCATLQYTYNSLNQTEIAPNIFIFSTVAQQGKDPDTEYICKNYHVSPYSRNLNYIIYERIDGRKRPEKETIQHLIVVRILFLSHNYTEYVVVCAYLCVRVCVCLREREFRVYLWWIW